MKNLKIVIYGVIFLNVVLYCDYVSAEIVETDQNISKQEQKINNKSEKDNSSKSWISNWSINVGAIHKQMEYYSDTDNSNYIKPDFIGDSINFYGGVSSQKNYFGSTNLGYQHVIGYNQFECSEQLIQDPYYIDAPDDYSDIGTHIKMQSILYTPILFYNFARKKASWSFSLGFGYGVGYFDAEGTRFVKESGVNRISELSKESFSYEDFNISMCALAELNIYNFVVSYKIHTVGGNVTLGVGREDDVDANFLSKEIVMMYEIKF